MDGKTVPTNIFLAAFVDGTIERTGEIGGNMKTGTQLGSTN